MVPIRLGAEQRLKSRVHMLLVRIQDVTSDIILTISVGQHHLSEEDLSSLSTASEKVLHQFASSLKIKNMDVFS